MGHGAMMKIRYKNLLFCFFGVVLLIVILKVYFSAPFVEEEIVDINSMQQRQLDMYIEMIKLLITLGTFLFGAIAAMFAHFYERRSTPRPQVRLALLAIILSGVSILCGYLSYHRVIWMLQVNVFNLAQPRIVWTSHLQFFLFLASAIAAAWFGYRATEEDENETTNDFGCNRYSSDHGKLCKPAPEQQVRSADSR